LGKFLTMIAANTSGFKTPHSKSSFFVTVTYSVVKNTPVTPSMAKTRFASGDFMPSRALAKLTGGPSGSTGFPGRNISDAGLGVVWVWMKMDRRWVPSAPNPPPLCIPESRKDVASLATGKPFGTAFANGIATTRHDEKPRRHGDDC
jgi:hypothetical protein